MRVLICLPNSGDADRWRRVCVEWCQRRHHEVVAVLHIQDDGAEQWQQVRRLAWLNHFDLLVVGRSDHLPSRRLPRIVVISDDPGSGRRQVQRPRVIR